MSKGLGAVGSQDPDGTRGNFPGAGHAEGSLPRATFTDGHIFPRTRRYMGRIHARARKQQPSVNPASWLEFFAASSPPASSWDAASEPFSDVGRTPKHIWKISVQPILRVSNRLIRIVQHRNLSSNWGAAKFPNSSRFPDYDNFKFALKRVAFRGYLLGRRDRHLFKL